MMKNTFSLLATFLIYTFIIFQYFHNELDLQKTVFEGQINTLKLQLKLQQAILSSQIDEDYIYTIRNVKFTFYSNDKQSINVAIYRDGYTATMIPVGMGIIAVDPKVIPYGSIVFIPQIKKFFIAADTGSAIKGKHIDIYVNSRTEAIKYGVQYGDVIVCGRVDIFKLRNILYYKNIRKSRRNINEEL